MKYTLVIIYFDIEIKHIDTEFKLVKGIVAQILGWIFISERESCLFMKQNGYDT